MAIALYESVSSAHAVFLLVRVHVPHQTVCKLSRSIRETRLDQPAPTSLNELSQTV